MITLDGRCLTEELLAAITSTFLVFHGFVLTDRISHNLDSLMGRLQEILHDLMVLIQERVQLLD